MAEKQESLSSISLVKDSKGNTKPEVKIYSKSNSEEDIKSAKEMAIIIFDSLVIKYCNL